VGDMSGSDARVSGEICHGEERSLNWRHNLTKGEAVWARAEVGGVGSSDDPVPDLWFGQLAGERSGKGGGDGPRGLQAPVNSGNCKSHCIGKRAIATRKKELGKPDAGKPPVRFDEGREADGHWHCLSIRRFLPTLHLRSRFGKVRCRGAQHSN
jgi:hypothetical protein